MTGEPTNAELLVHIEYIRKAADSTNAHLAKLNGRVADVEDDIGAVKTQVAVIESQSADAKSVAVKWGGLVGGVIAGAGVVWQFFQGGGK